MGSRLLAAALLAGCAGPGGQACQGVDWYSAGFRDAIFLIQAQDGVHAHRCQGSFESARYLQGWREGKYEADARVPGSVD